MTTHILFLCTHNSARSVLAEAMLNHLARLGGHDVLAYSAGSAPSHRVNPSSIEVLMAAGIDCAGLTSKSWDVFTTPDAPLLDAVITVCDSAARESCPIFLGHTNAPAKVHWGYPDPSRMEGDDLARRTAFDLTRQAIGYRLLQLLALPLPSLDRNALQQRLHEIGQN